MKSFTLLNGNTIFIDNMQYAHPRTCTRSIVPLGFAASLQWLKIVTANKFKWMVLKIFQSEKYGLCMWPYFCTCATCAFVFGFSGI